MRNLIVYVVVLGSFFILIGFRDFRRKKISKPDNRIDSSNAELIPRLTVSKGVSMDNGMRSWHISLSNFTFG